MKNKYVRSRARGGMAETNTGSGGGKEQSRWWHSGDKGVCRVELWKWDFQIERVGELIQGFFLKENWTLFPGNGDTEKPANFISKTHKQ